MRRALGAIAAVTVLSVGVAHAAPSFGASSHRLGGGAEKSQSHKSQSHQDPISWVVALLGVVGLDLTAKVDPVVGEALDERRAKAKQCDEAKKAEIAEAGGKASTDGAGSKGRGRTGEPVYLAF